MNNNTKILEALIGEDFGLVNIESNFPKSEEHSSLVLDKRKGIFFWNSMEIVGDPLVYLTKVRKLSFNDAKEFLRNFEYSGTHVCTIKGYEDDVIVYPELIETFYRLGKLKERRDYLYRRGLTNETIDRFQIGWYNDFTMIPFFINGTFRNFQMRKDIPNKRIKSYYKGVGPLLFNSDILKLVSVVFIVEGPLDALILLQHGIPAISTNSGGVVSPEWHDKFVDQKIIYLVMDNDDAGRKEAKRTAKNLGTTRCRIYTFQDYEQVGFDPIDYFLDGNTDKDFLKLIEEKSQWLWEME
jgi:DNA primase